MYYFCFFFKNQKYFKCVVARRGKKGKDAPCGLRTMGKKRTIIDCCCCCFHRHSLHIVVIIIIARQAKKDTHTNKDNER